MSMARSEKKVCGMRWPCPNLVLHRSSRTPSFSHREGKALASSGKTKSNEVWCVTYVSNKCWYIRIFTNHSIGQKVFLHALVFLCFPNLNFRKNTDFKRFWCLDVWESMAWKLWQFFFGFHCLYFPLRFQLHRNIMKLSNKVITE